MAKRPQQKSEYGLQLQEKQKIKKEYGVRERQFKSYIIKGKDSDSIFALLELRLDSVVYASGFAPTRRAARQLVSHGHVLVNDRRSNIASHQLKLGDKVVVKVSSKNKGMFEDYTLRTKNYEPPSWLKVNKSKMEVEIKGTPDLKEQLQPFNLQTVIEFYSR